MSLFFPTTLSCPKCGEPVSFEANASVNADRRPDLREQILKGTFQQGTCAKCATVFRLDPQMNYLDVGRGQWLIAFPAAKLRNWPTIENEARTAFAKSYGKLSSPAAQEIGRDLCPRVVFGWASVSEKLLASEKQLDDVELELLKLALIRGMDNPPIATSTELRLVDVNAEPAELVIAALDAATAGLIEEFNVPHELYDQIAADQKDWKPLRDELTGGLFVDYRRLIVDTGAKPTEKSSKK